MNRQQEVQMDAAVRHAQESKKEQKLYAVRLTNSEVAEIRDMTKVDAVGPAVRSIVIKEIERWRGESLRSDFPGSHECEPNHEPP